MKVIANGLALRRSRAAPVLQNGEAHHFTRVRVVAIVLWHSQRWDDAIFGADGCSQMRGLAVEFITVIKYSIFARSPVSKPVLEIFDAQPIPLPPSHPIGVAMRAALDFRSLNE